MNIKPIKSENEYRQALSRIEVIFDSAIGTNESDEADILALMIDDYEQKNYSIEAPDPIEAIKIRMEEMGLKQKDLVHVIGGKNRVSEILHKKRKLTLEMIRNLIDKLNLSADTLLKDYPLAD